MLPSYEEATTSRDFYSMEEPSSSSQSDNIRRLGTADRQSNVSESRTESSVISSTIAVTSTAKLDDETPSSQSNNGDGNHSSVQSLLLSAGTSLNASVMINSPPPDLCHVNDLASDIDNAPAGAYGRKNSDDDAMLVLDSDPECNLDTIFPSNSASLGSSVNQRPTCTDSEHNLLNYPLRPVDYATDNFLEPHSFSVIINPSNIPAEGEDDQEIRQDILEPVSCDSEAVQNCAENCYTQGEDMLLNFVDL